MKRNYWYIYYTNSRLFIETVVDVRHLILVFGENRIQKQKQMPLRISMDFGNLEKLHASGHFSYLFYYQWWCGYCNIGVEYWHLALALALAFSTGPHCG